MIRQRADEFSRLMSILSENLEGDVQQRAKEQVERFRLWASHIGVFAPYRWSLDYRLRNSPEVSTILIRMLDVLMFKMRVININYASERSPSQLISTGRRVGGNEGQEPGTLEIKKTADQHIQLEELDEIAKIIGRLHRLSLAIRKASSASISSRSANFRIHNCDDGSLGAETFESGELQFRNYFKTVIQHRAPILSHARLEMLTNLSFSRRQRFSYMAFHQEKLRSATPEHFATDAKLAESVAKHVPEPTRALDEHSESRASTFDPSQFVPQPTESVVSSQLSLPSVLMNNGNIPGPPRVPPGCEELECPYCFYILPKKYFLSSRRWRLHLQQDLQPYVCLYEECLQFVRTFSSVKHWVQHINDFHLSQWICPLHRASEAPKFTFETESALGEHLNQAHGAEYSVSQTKTILRQGKRKAPGKPQLFESCPFCNECSKDSNMGNFEQNIASHLLDISLMSLPWRDDVEDEKGSQQSSVGALSVSDCSDLVIRSTSEDNNRSIDEGGSDLSRRTDRASPSSSVFAAIGTGNDFEQQLPIFRSSSATVSGARNSYDGSSTYDSHLTITNRDHLSKFIQAYESREQSTAYSTAYGSPSPDLINSQRLQLVSRDTDQPPSIETIANTQPELLRLGIVPRRHFRGTHGSVERLDPSFKIRRPGYDFFKKGLVFRVLWPELAGDTDQRITIATTSRFDGENFFVKVRWFVVVREGNDCCTCLSIQTYGNRGVPENKVKNHHAIMYTSDTPPEPLPSERPRWAGELPMGDAIRVIGNKPWANKMDSKSRVNFLKVYTVEHNVKVDDFGYVDKSDEWKLIAQFNFHWNIPGGDYLPPVTRPSYPQWSSSIPTTMGQSTLRTYPPVSTTSSETARGWNEPHYVNAPSSYSMRIIPEDSTGGHEIPVPREMRYPLYEEEAIDETYPQYQNELVVRLPAGRTSSSKSSNKSHGRKGKKYTR